MIDVDNELSDFVNAELEDQSFEDLLEVFDLTPAEVFVHLFNSGLVDEEQLKAYLLDA